jgi:formylglycine-generating enzyme required for sulfatase activity
MGRLRARTGLAFDLPTESQWEYAGRAGTATALNSGFNLTNTSIDARMAQVGRYWHNGGSGYTRNGTASVGTAKAGSYLPNAWGLYDIHGNVWEWSLDWNETYPGTVTDPLGPTSGLDRVYRGGGWDGDADVCRSARRNFITPGTANDSSGGGIGFRAVLPPGQ